ncbi:MAG: leucine-rich repeat protein [Acutalibacteraceae bacterium]
MKQILKRFLTVTLAAVLIICAVPIASDAYLNDFEREQPMFYSPESPEFLSDGLVASYDEDGLITVRAESGSVSGTYTVPDEINSIAVTGIEYLHLGAEELIIPDSVRDMSEASFDSELKKLMIGKNVESLDLSGFDRCDNLAELVFPSSLKELAFSNISRIKKLSSLKTVRFSGEYQSLKVSAYIDTSLEFPEQTQIIFEGRPSYDIWFYLVNGGYEFVEADGVFYCKKADEKQIYTSGGYQYFLDEDDNAVISAYTGEEDDTLIIPAVLDGHTVVKIGNNAFDNRASLPTRPLKEVEAKESGFAFKKVSVPSTVTAIGDFAFSYCTNLQEVELPDSVEKIGYSAFENCSGLSEVTFPKNIKTICDAAFYYCGLSQVSLPEGTEYVGSYAFANDVFSLGQGFNSKIELADSIEYIGNMAFANSDVTQVVMPKSLRYLGTAFDYCIYLTSVTLNDGLKIIDGAETGGAFHKTAVAEITIPSSVESIGSCAFFDCSKLKKVSFADGSELKSISEGAFQFTYIDEIAIPDTVEYIGESAFFDCYRMKKASLPAMLKNLGWNCFGSCEGLTEIVLPESLRSIGQECFCNTSIESIILPENLSFIGTLAFKECDKLKSVTLNSVSCEAGYGVWYKTGECLPQQTFRDNKKLSLQSVTIGENVESLGQYLFSGLTVDKLEINKSIKSLHSKCFEDAVIGELYFDAPDCLFVDREEYSSIVEYNDNEITVYCSPFKYTDIDSFIFGEHLNCVPDWILSWVQQIKSVSIPQTVRSIGTGAFFHCESLTAVDVPDSVEYLGDYSFLSCRNLVTVNMSKYVSKIGDFAFWNCNKLCEFNWPSPVKIIGRDAFKNCASLMNFDFENTEFTQGSFAGVAAQELRFGLNDSGAENIEIPDSCFMSCQNLDMVALGEKVQSVNSKAFAECKNLETALIADSVEEIAPDAFDGCNKLTIYCNEDSYAQQYAKENGIKVTTLVIDPIPNQVYNGKELKPSLNVHYSGNLLTAEKDFSTQYYNNINVGTANAVVSGKGDLSMLVSKVDFAVVAADINSAKVGNIPTQTLSDSPCTPEIKLTYGDAELKQGVDYTVTYQNNTQEGTATATIKGIGNFKGVRYVDFEISETQGNPIARFFKAVWNLIVVLFHMIFN